MPRGAGLWGSSPWPLGCRAKHSRTGPAEINSSLCRPAGARDPHLRFPTQTPRDPARAKEHVQPMTQLITCAMLIFHISSDLHWCWEILEALSMKRYNLKRFFHIWTYSLFGHQPPLGQVISRLRSYKNHNMDFWKDIGCATLYNLIPRWSEHCPFLILSNFVLTNLYCTFYFQIKLCFRQHAVFTFRACDGAVHSAPQCTHSDWLMLLQGLILIDLSSAWLENGNYMAVVEV